MVFLKENLAEKRFIEKHIGKGFSPGMPRRMYLFLFLGSLLMLPSTFNTQSLRDFAKNGIAVRTELFSPLLSFVMI